MFDFPLDGLAIQTLKYIQVFKRNGLVQVSPLGEKFNPNLHEALFQQVETFEAVLRIWSRLTPDFCSLQPIEGKESGTVIEVKKVGYTLHDRCIRPALVGVAK